MEQEITATATTAAVAVAAVAAAVTTTATNTNKDAPAVVRRRRKIARQMREQTPDRSRSHIQSVTMPSDPESSCSTNSYRHQQQLKHQQQTQQQLPQQPHIVTGERFNDKIHESRILRRRNKNFDATRSLSQGRGCGDDSFLDENEVRALMREANKRSLSAPRQIDGVSSDSSYEPSANRIKPILKESSGYSRSRQLEDIRQAFDRTSYEQERRQRSKRLQAQKLAHKMSRSRPKSSALQSASERSSTLNTDEEKYLLIRKFIETQKLHQPLLPPDSPPRDRSPEGLLSEKNDTVWMASHSSNEDLTSSTVSDSDASAFNDVDHVTQADVASEELPLKVNTIDVTAQSELKIEVTQPEEQMDLTDKKGEPIILATNTNVDNNNINKPLTAAAAAAATVAVATAATPDVVAHILIKPVSDKVAPTSASSLKPQTVFQTFRSEVCPKWRQFKLDKTSECAKLKLLRNKCFVNLIVLIIYCGLGGLVFRFVEGAFENIYKCGVNRVKRDFVDYLWTTSHNLREEDWKSQARMRLRKFEEDLINAHEAGMTSYSGMKAWTFLNGITYCLTVITTIGYGHISPRTTTGRAITILYGVFGIPLFLILLADFGKLFTRGIKFLWAFVRRLYFTGSCRKVRKTAQVQEMMRGINKAYEMATFRRPSFMPKENPTVVAQNLEADAANKSTAPTASAEEVTCDSPITPLPETFEIDDEFNLPISLAFCILMIYIIIGAALYSFWEDWSFFESFYFVFISMSTIGFGDFVPKHPMYMMASILYLVFGLALTSMCINVVQVKLSDSFRDATNKIGATIGLKIAEEEAAIESLLNSPNLVEKTENDVETGEKKPPPLLPVRNLALNQPKLIAAKVAQPPVTVSDKPRKSLLKKTKKPMKTDNKE